MLKHERLIKKMTRRQKVALLCDPSAPSDVEAGSLGIPAVKSADLSALAEKNGFPSFGSLSASWDTQLTEQISCALAAESRRSDHTNLYITPDLKCAANAYSGGLSDDAYLNGAIGSAIVRGVHADGSACALARLSCAENDVKFLDSIEDEQAIHDLFVKPFLYTMRSTPCEAIISSLERPCGGYVDANIKLFGEALSGSFGSGAFVIGESVSGDVKFHDFISKGACVMGVGRTVDRALGRYDEYSQSLANGSISQNDFNGALDSGIAINPETVDASVDRAIEFAFAVNQIKPTVTQTLDINKLSYRAAVESIVLLKNNGALPLSKGKRVAAVGGRAEKFKSLSGLNVTAVSEGFPDNKDDAAVKDNAVRAAAQADVVLVFLDCERKEDGTLRKLSLPANLSALVSRLKNTEKCIIGVLPTGVPMDLSSDGDFNAILTAPYESAYCDAALGAVLDGREFPCGRLSRSYYVGGDHRFKSLRDDRDAGIAKIGKLCGYRLVDVSGEKQRYSFGYGLSYTNFTYSGLHVGKQSVRFTIKNIGKCAGYEVPQLYVGSPADPNGVKELKAFSRVYLKPGERREVTLNLPSDCFEIYDADTKTSKALSGVYKIYVGASSSDIRLRGALKSGGGRAASRAEEGQKSISDRLKYRLSSVDGKPARKGRRWVNGISIALIVASLVAFIAVGLTAWAKDSLDGYYTYFIIIGGVFALSLITLIAEIVIHKKSAAKKAEAKPRTAAFKSPVLKTTTTREVFEKAFEGDSGGNKQNQKNKFDEPKYLDRDFTFNVISKELETFTAERGFKISAENTRRLVSALAASRAIIFPAESEKQLNKLAPVLCGYLGTELFACDYDIYGGNASKGVLARAVKQAEKTPEKMYILLYRRVTADALADLVFAKTFDHASRLNKLGKQGDVIIPPNLWILAAASDGGSVGNLPPDIAESVCLMNLEMTEAGAALRTTAVKPLGFYQFYNLCGGVRGEYGISEGMWKRIDRFEEKLGEDVFHSVGNRTWIKMEKFAAVYLACGGGETEALDGAVATQLLVALQTVLSEKEIDDGQLVSTLEEVFGQENIEYCRKIVRTYFRDGYNGKKGEK